MASKKTKNKSFLLRKKTRPLYLLIIGLIIVGFVFHSNVNALFHHMPPLKKTDVSKIIPKTNTSTPKPATIPTPSTTTLSTLPPKPKVTPKAHTVVTPAPQPVVTPSPSSSVSGLTPSTPSNGGGNSGVSSGPTKPTPPLLYNSTNWAGYMATNGLFSGVSGSWTATTPTGNNTTISSDGTWIGIGGITTSDLIQIGTFNAVSAGGQVTTTAFYEMLPKSAQSIPSLSVSPGDSITASITSVSGDQFSLSIADNTTSQTFNKILSYNSSGSSAEWIEEDPSMSARRQYPLDHFGTASFTGSAAVINGVSSTIGNANYNKITLVDYLSNPLATTSALGSDGASFSVAHN